MSSSSQGHCWHCQHEALLYVNGHSGALTELGEQAHVLSMAARDNDLDALQREVSHGTPVDISYPSYGGTALDHAANLGHLEAVRWLVENANASVETHGGVLAQAARSCHAEIVKYLIKDARAAVDYMGCSHSETALHSAIASNQGQTQQIVELLLDHRATPDLAAAPGEGYFAGTTPLMIAADRGSQAVVQSLLAAGASANTSDDQNRAALYFAVKRGDLNLAQCLLDAGADVNAADVFGMTALHIAALKAAKEEPVAGMHLLSLLRELLQRGADVDARTSGKSLGVAAGSNSFDIVLQPRFQKNSWYGDVMAVFTRRVLSLEIEQLEPLSKKDKPALVSARDLSGEVVAMVGIDLRKDDLHALVSSIKQQSGIATAMQQLTLGEKSLDSLPLSYKLQCLVEAEFLRMRLLECKKVRVS